MMFWSIVLGVVALLLVLAWLSDRRSRGTGRFRRRNIQQDVEIYEGKTAENMQRFQPPRPPGFGR